MEETLQPLHRQESSQANLILEEASEGPLDAPLSYETLFWKDISAESNYGKQVSDPLLFCKDFPSMYQNTEAHESTVALEAKAKRAKTKGMKPKGAKPKQAKPKQAKPNGTKTSTLSKMKKRGSGPSTPSTSNEMWFQWLLSKINRVEEQLTTRDSTIENLSFHVTELQQKNEFELLLFNINHVQETNASTAKMLEYLSMQVKALEIQIERVVENMIDMVSKWQMLTQNACQSTPPPSRVPMFGNTLNLQAHYRAP